MTYITRNDLHKHFILTITFLLYTFLFTLLLLSIERFTSINWEICSFNLEVIQSFERLGLSIKRFTISISRGFSFYWEICSFYWEGYSFYLSGVFILLRDLLIPYPPRHTIPPLYYFQHSSFYHEWLSFNLEVCFSLSLILLHSIERFTSIIREIGSFNLEVYSFYLSFYFNQSIGLLQTFERFIHSISRFTSIYWEVGSFNWEVCSFNWEVIHYINRFTSIIQEVYSFYLSFYFLQSLVLLQSIERFVLSIKRFTSINLSGYIILLRGLFNHSRGLFI